MSQTSPLELFLTQPTVADMQRHRAVGSDPGYFEPYSIRRELQPLLESYFLSVEGEIPEADAARILQVAQSYASESYIGIDQLRKPDRAAQYVRLYALLQHPRFLLDSCVVDLMKILAHLSGGLPWNFQMWSTDDSELPSVRPGIGEEHITSFHSLIACDELWKHRELRRIFFCAVAHVLRKLSQDKGLVAEAAPARIDLLLKNGISPHEPTCHALFRQPEIDALRAQAADNDAAKSLLHQIEEHNLMFYDHLC